MQAITPLPSAAANLATALSGTDRNGKTPNGVPASALRADQAIAPQPAPVSDEDTVSISAQAPATAEEPPRLPVYAEIWKDDVKLAQIDMRGQVYSFTGQATNGNDAALGGPLLAAQRAIQLARQTGGEIRTAGQALDSQTILMRARLATTYISQ